MRKTALATLLVLALGCPAGTGGGSGKAGGKSPEATFKTMQSAALKQDNATMFACMDPQSHDSVLLGMTIAAGFLSFGKDETQKKAIEDGLQGILDKHGVVQLGNDEVKMTDKASMDQAASKMFGGVKDKPALFAELTAFIEKNSEKKAPKKNYGEGTLKDVKVEGDKATATFEKPDGSSQPVKFINRDGLWYVGV